MIERAFIGYGLDLAPGGLGLYIKVCSACPDRADLERWAAQRGLRMSHGYCPSCAQAAMERVLGEKSAHSRLTGYEKTPA